MIKVRSRLIGAVAGVALLAGATLPAAAGEFCFLWICIPTGPGGSGGHSAPGPLLGAGLPFAVVGLGAAWLLRRRRETV